MMLELGSMQVDLDREVPEQLFVSHHRFIAI
jgi:hypothetical protein